MDEMTLRIIASILTACFLCLSTVKSLGVLQQSGYKNGAFYRWLKRKDNLCFNRLWVLSLCLALATTIVSLCFFFLGYRLALAVSAIPFFGLLLLFWHADRKYALKVPVKRTGRVVRLLGVYFLFVTLAAYILTAVLDFLADWNGSAIYRLISYAPFAIMPMLLPVLLMAANGIEGVFEEARNKKYVKRAEQVLNESEIIRVGIVGSYGKTSVKNILATLLAEKYEVVATPESYNTPLGIAKTVFSHGFAGKQIFIAEMGARKQGDITELCEMVKPDYAVLTGICEQHIQSFGSLKNIWAEKSKILQSGIKKAVCNESLKSRIEADFPSMLEEKVVFVGGDPDADYGSAATTFTLNVFGEKVSVTTTLLGNAAVENIRLAAQLCVELGMTADEIVRGIEQLEQIPHRLELLENEGVYILDDGYNCNPKGAEEAIRALGRFVGRKCIVTPGIIECGILEEKINGELGEKIANAKLDKVILVGDTLVGKIKSAYENAGGDMEILSTVRSLDDAKNLLGKWVQSGDAVLFLNDLPDFY